MCSMKTKDVVDRLTPDEFKENYNYREDEDDYEYLFFDPCENCVHSDRGTSQTIVCINPKSESCFSVKGDSTCDDFKPFPEEEAKEEDRRRWRERSETEAETEEEV
jgi:hypothetical protein